MYTAMFKWSLFLIAPHLRRRDELMTSDPLSNGLTEIRFGKLCLNFVWTTDYRTRYLSSWIGVAVALFARMLQAQKAETCVPAAFRHLESNLRRKNAWRTRYHSATEGLYSWQFSKFRWKLYFWSTSGSLEGEIPLGALNTFSVLRKELIRRCLRVEIFVRNFVQLTLFFELIFLQCLVDVLVCKYVS